jgi:hypothetical protein
MSRSSPPSLDQPSIAEVLCRTIFGEVLRYNADRIVECKREICDGYAPTIRVKIETDTGVDSIRIHFEGVEILVCRNEECFRFAISKPGFCLEDELAKLTGLVIPKAD